MVESLLVINTVITILTPLLMAFLELLKHIKRSKCCNSTIEMEAVETKENEKKN